ncbi:MAG TPA: hypothetical protein VG826_06400 [Pirellulales bacterium]|nr:hypothetical protein [Pirellulales bacterium]
MLVLALCGSTAADTLAEKRRAIEHDYAEGLTTLARWCDERKLPKEAAKTREWIVPQPPLTLVICFPDDAFPESIGNQVNAEWCDRFRKLRQTQGQRLFELAQTAAGDRDFAQAIQLAHQTLREDPDHEAARRLLGYKRHERKWLSRYEVDKVQAHQVWHERFGWLQAKHLSRYESGERSFKGRWISAEEDARLHADIDRGWDIVTEHYQVRTNHSLEEGVRLATRLEDFYRIWRQVLVGYCSTDDQLTRQFRTGLADQRMPPRHQVVCFRDRDEYAAALARSEPNIGITSGYYAESTRRSYFFVGEDSDLYHEATHQLFNELKPVKQAGREANFWIVEGIACFMESYKLGNRLAMLGGSDALRLENARARLLEHGSYMPLAELCGLGMTELQRHPEIKMLYSEAAGMTYFFLFADGGRYRPALVDYLSAVYEHRDRLDTLADLTGTSYGSLDEQYRKFIQQLP